MGYGTVDRLDQSSSWMESFFRSSLDVFVVNHHRLSAVLEAVGSELMLWMLPNGFGWRSRSGWSGGIRHPACQVFPPCPSGIMLGFQTFRQIFPQKRDDKLQE